MPKTRKFRFPGAAVFNAECGAYPDRALPCQLAPAGSSTADASAMRARPGAVLAPVDVPSLRTMSQTIIFHR